jgi:rod shape determining protein RodA
LRLPWGEVTLQPAELAKPATLLFLSWLVSRPALRLHRMWFLVSVSVVTAIPVVLICIQPDWGTAAVFVPMALVVVFLGGLRWRWIAMGLVGILAAAPVVSRSLDQHQKERIEIFLQPAKDVSDAGWNAHQSLLAVGSGGVWGKGFMAGTQHVLGFLPRPVTPTDFIFSVVGEETGFIGAGAVVCAFLGVILCCLRSAASAADEFGVFLSAGMAALLFVHVYVNIGMTVQVAPIVGIPLPLVSYGGSFMLSVMIGVGLVQSVHVRCGEART